MDQLLNICFVKTWFSRPNVIKFDYIKHVL